MSGTTQGPKPHDASFAHVDRWTAPKQTQPIQVIVEGVVCDGELLGKNGPRAQVRFVKDGSSFVRWFDASAVLDLPE